jgi:2-hydroxy-3-keto-5-methylthiopentenyl-1-phosphate phosphatase
LGRTYVVDFDGTITEDDMLIAIEDAFGDASDVARVDALFDAGELTLREEITGKFASVTAPLDEVVAWTVEHARVRPGFARFVEHVRAEGARLVVVSSGFHELIAPVLAREGVELEVRANHVDTSDGPWRVRWTYGEPCETCGESCKRTVVRDLAAGDEVVYVGDGYSDRCAALASERVFATRGLADYLEREHIPFERFADFDDIVRHLDVE